MAKRIRRRPWMLTHEEFRHLNARRVRRERDAHARQLADIDEQGQTQITLAQYEAKLVNLVWGWAHV